MPENNLVPRNPLSPEAKNFFIKYWDEAKAILFHPKNFFENLPLDGGYSEPIYFALTSSVICAVLTGLMSTDMMIGFSSILGAMAGTFIMSGVAVFFARVFKGQADFQSIYRVVAYATAPLIFAWVPVLGGAASVYGFYMSFRGFRRIMGLTPGKTIIVLAISVLISSVLTGIVIFSLILKSKFHI